MSEVARMAVAALRLMVMHCITDGVGLAILIAVLVIAVFELNSTVTSPLRATSRKVAGRGTKARVVEATLLSEVARTDVAALHLRVMYLIGDGVRKDHRKTVPVLTVVMSQPFARNPMSQFTLSS